MVIIGTAGGVAVSLLRGFKMNKNGILPKIVIPALLKDIIIPPLIGMIIFACIAINFIGPIMKAFPTAWIGYMKYCCHCTLLIRAGLQIEPRGRPLTVLLLTLIP